MLTTHVAPPCWGACLDAFSRRHAHETATVEVHEPQHAVGEVFVGPLLGAELEHDPDGHESVFVSIGDASTAHWSRVIAHPKQVSVFCDLDGADQALEIESDDGGYTFIRL